MTAPDTNAPPAQPRKRGRFERIIPALVFVALLIAWEALVRVREIPPYILPAPSLIASTLVADWSVLASALWVTVRTTFLALLLATVGGLALALAFARWRVIEASLFPIAVILQVTPIIAIAPLLLVYLEPGTAVLVCAFIVAFFPILSNAVLGLRSADRNLVELYKLYGATPWQELALLRLPAALPYFLGGLRIGGGLALIGAIVAEIAAGAAGRGAGLAFRIVEAGYRLNIPRMFAALALVSATGVAIYLLFSLLSRLLLGRWHDSERQG
jgi:NitT/TauT family transport system permease protein